MTLRLNSTGGGHIEIDAPNTASNFSVTMPAAAGDVVVADASGDIQTTRTGTGGTSASALVVGYQQGIWIPKMGSTNGDSTHTYAVNVGTWTRIGNLVTINFDSTISTLGSNGSGIAGVTGLPYLPDSQNSYSGVINYAANFAASFNPVVLRCNNTDSFAFYKYELSVGHSNIGVGRYTATSTANGMATFITADTTWTPINGATVS